MEEVSIRKVVAVLALALVVAGVGGGLYTALGRPASQGVPERLSREFRELTAFLGRPVADPRELTQAQLDLMLYASVGNGSPEMVGWLLRRGGSPRANATVFGASHADRSALQHAAGKGACEQEKVLVKAVEAQALASASGTKEDKAARAAAEVAAYVNERDSYLRGALHHAVLGGARACIATLLDAGARVDARDAGGSTPLALAREKRLDYLVPILRAALIRQGGVDDAAQANTPR